MSKNHRYGTCHQQPRHKHAEYLAHRKSQHLLECKSPSYILHTRQTCVLKKLSNELQKHHLIVPRADKGKKTFIMNNHSYHQKIETFLTENQFLVLHKDPRSRDSVVGITTRYGLDSPGIESRWGARFSAPVQTDSETHPAFNTMGNGSFPAVKRPGRGVDHPLLSSAEIKERVELYLYFPSGFSWPVLGWTLPKNPNSICQKQIQQTLKKSGYVTINIH
jgi:hypothetical protein